MAAWRGDESGAVERPNPQRTWSSVTVRTSYGQNPRLWSACSEVGGERPETNKGDVCSRLSGFDSERVALCGTLTFGKPEQVGCLGWLRTHTLGQFPATIAKPLVVARDRRACASTWSSASLRGTLR